MGNFRKALNKWQELNGGVPLRSNRLEETEYINYALPHFEDEIVAYGKWVTH